MASLNDIETKIQSIIDILYSRIVKTITGILPLTFTANAGNSVDWSISGNDDVGENLFEGTYRNGYINGSGQYLSGPTVRSAFIKVEANTQYSIKTFDITNRFYVAVYDHLPDDSDTGTLLTYSTAITEHSYTLTTLADTMYIGVYVSNQSEEPKMVCIKGSTAPDRYIPYQQGVGEQRVDGYYIPLTVSQQGQTNKNYDIYIGDTPLTAGQSISKTSTGVDIELLEGENTVSTTLYNKPEMSIKYKYNGGN